MDRNPICIFMALYQDPKLVGSCTIFNAHVLLGPVKMQLNSVKVELLSPLRGELRTIISGTRETIRTHRLYVSEWLDLFYLSADRLISCMISAVGQRGS